MAAMDVHLILIIVSLVIGLFLMISASVLLNHAIDGDSFCDLSSNWICDAVNGVKAGTSLGIIGSLVQMGYCGFIMFRHFAQGTSAGSMKKMSLIVHVVLLVVTLIAFSVAVHYGNKKVVVLNVEARLFESGKTGFFDAVAGLDWIFCIGVIVASVILKD